MTQPSDQAAPPALIDDLAHWGSVVARAQAMLIEFATEQMLDPSVAVEARDAMARLAQAPLQPAADAAPAVFDPHAIVDAQADYWMRGLDLWRSMMDAGVDAMQASFGAPAPAAQDRRFGHADWADHPVYAAIRQTYQFVSDRLIAVADAVEGIPAGEKEKLRFGTRALVDAMAPTNFALTNPAVLERAIETRGESLLKGLSHMLADIRRGQMSHTDPSAFELGRNLAITPGFVVHETPLYQLIQYSPVTERVRAVPVVIFPPWINRFYILDLNPEKSFVRWAVEQGLTTFMVSWKSADAAMADVAWDDYVAAQIDAVDTIRRLLDVPAVHAIGYCVAGTTLAATLAVLTARDRADRVRSATFFTAQVDFSEAGDLKLFTSDDHMALLERVSEAGYLDGRYMAATFNALRGRDLIWNYVVNNYLMGDDYPPFDLLHWNGDTTNLPRTWHRGYLTDLYRDNRLVVPGSMVVHGVPIDLSTVRTPAYVQAGREDHIAPAASVWKTTRALGGPVRFVLAGSGHIAGVVNPPAAAKYHHWLNPDAQDFADFVAGAKEVKGSWWPDWLAWLDTHDTSVIVAEGNRAPDALSPQVIEPAPGRYVRER